MSSWNLFSMYYAYCSDLKIHFISSPTSSFRTEPGISIHDPPTFSFQDLEKGRTSPLHSFIEFEINLQIPK